MQIKEISYIAGYRMELYMVSLLFIEKSKPLIAKPFSLSQIKK